MGNKLCKKKTDVVVDTTTITKSPTPFDRIINRLHLRPNSWRSDSQLNQKQANRNSNEKPEVLIKEKPLSKSSDWTDATLEVNDKEDSIHFHNPKLSLMFNNDQGTPTPPPRKHKKSIREKIEAVAKSGLQAFQSKTPVEEPLCVKKIVKPTCPIDEHDCSIHNRNHKHDQKKRDMNEDNVKLSYKEGKRRKNLSVISLPNYNELKLTVAHFDDIDKKPEQVHNNDSASSLPGETKKLTASTGKLETCMTRCRSFGSLLPQQLLERLRSRTIQADIESDDSFGALEDWDLKILEHYNPKDASLPRPRKVPKNKHDTLSDIESLIVKEEDIESPVPLPRKSVEMKLSQSVQKSVTPNLSQSNTPAPAEHSTLMKILEQFTVKDAQKNAADEKKDNDLGEGCNLQNQLKERINIVDDFLRKEKETSY